MEINKTNIQEIVKTLNLSPNKNLGQNFLIAPEISEKITSLISPNKNQKVLEIGPGLGSLTHFLSSYDLTVVDIDYRMVDFLNTVYKDNSNIKVIKKDILRFDVSDFDFVVANLPYYITTDIITYLLLKAKKAQKFVFMVQKEAFSRFSAKCKEDGYGPISILVSYLGNAKKEFIVGQSNFYPNPHVDSLVFSIELNPENHNTRNLGAYKLAKTMFLNRRKTIFNNLSSFLKDKDSATNYLNELNVPLNKRPEELEPSFYLDLYDLLLKEDRIKE